jgi:predicted lysophospholipase L1 biosynthesis ABC-type transport system permease subunit
VVNLAFARRYFHADAPLGRTFRRDDGVQHVIVGIAGDARYSGLRGGAEPTVYMPMKPPRVFTLYVRSALAPAPLAALVAREARAVGFGMRVRDVTTLGSLVAATVTTERLLADTGAACALLALVLAVVGLFALLSQAVTERTPEFGVRMALGASRHGIYRLVLKEALGPTAAGLAGGVAAGLLAVHLARSLLFGIATVDVRVIAGALAAFLAAALLAAAVPARRAGRVDPVVALRRD